MTDQTPATEAGRRLNDWLRLSDNWPEVTSEESILAIEAEARATVYALLPLEREVGRADALREAAERVRARSYSAVTFKAHAVVLDEVLAILEPEATP